MNPVELALENLKELDFGKVPAAFLVERDHVVRDCMDRPHDDKPRKVTITFIFKPVIDTDSRTIDCESIDVGVEVSSTLPKRTTSIYSMSPKKNGMLTFHPDLKRDPDGSTLYDADQLNKDTGEVRE